MKTPEELNALKEEVEAVNKKLAELTDEELALISGGLVPIVDIKHDFGPSVFEPPVRDDQYYVSERPAL